LTTSSVKSNVDGIGVKTGHNVQPRNPPGVPSRDEGPDLGRPAIKLRAYTHVLKVGERQ
jgi:hypothetical protein